jgi:hypothetical protein
MGQVVRELNINAPPHPLHTERGRRAEPRGAVVRATSGEAAAPPRTSQHARDEGGRSALLLRVHVGEIKTADEIHDSAATFVGKVRAHHTSGNQNSCILRLWPITPIEPS